MRLVGDPVIRDRGRRVAGFTLLELMTALALTILLLVGGRRLLEQLTLGGETLHTESLGADNVANGARLLRTLLAGADAGADTTERFSGNELSATFPTWCDVPAGWPERCIATLSLTTVADSIVLFASLGRRGVVPVWRRKGSARLRYYGFTSGSLGWVKNWGTSIAVPLAVAIVSESAGDTILLPVGAGQ